MDAVKPAAVSAWSAQFGPQAISQERGACESWSGQSNEADAGVPCRVHGMEMKTRENVNWQIRAQLIPCSGRGKLL